MPQGTANPVLLEQLKEQAAAEHAAAAAAVSFAAAPPEAPVVHLPKIDVSDLKGKPLDDDAVKRLQQSAAAMVEKLNQVGGCLCVVWVGVCGCVRSAPR